MNPSWLWGATDTSCLMSIVVMIVIHDKVESESSWLRIRLGEWEPFANVYHRQFLSRTTTDPVKTWRQPQQIAFRGGGDTKRGKGTKRKKESDKGRRDVEQVDRLFTRRYRTTALDFDLKWTISSLLRTLSQTLKPSGRDQVETDRVQVATTE